MCILLANAIAWNSFPYVSAKIYFATRLNYRLILSLLLLLLQYYYYYYYYYYTVTIATSNCMPKKGERHRLNNPSDTGLQQ